MCCRYYVEFSKPDKLRPIPEGTVKVYFDITVGEGPGEYDVEFNFENESLKHRPDSTMREAKFQVRDLILFVKKQMSNYGAFFCFRAGLIEFSKTSTRLSNSCIWEQNSSILVTLIKKDIQLILLCPNSTS